MFCRSIHKLVYVGFSAKGCRRVQGGHQKISRIADNGKNELADHLFFSKVKNVLDRKLIDEIRRVMSENDLKLVLFKREQDIEILNSRIDTATVQAMQIQ